MLPSIREIIQQSDSNLLIVLHTYGSHYDYRKRYPQEFARYTPDLISAINKNNRSIMVNAYDNSVYYTDYVLDEIIKVLEGTQACTALFYSSDHGEDMMDDSPRALPACIADADLLPITCGLFRLVFARISRTLSRKICRSPVA